VAASDSNGLTITVSGGDGGRVTKYAIICDPTAAVSNPPEPLVTMPYTVTWKHPAGCGKPSTDPEACNVKVVKPTKELLAWQAQEIGALVCFPAAPTN
jgi:hypothetical protein